MVEPTSNVKEEDKTEEEKVDEKEYLPSFNLLDPDKTGSVPIDAVNELLAKLEGNLSLANGRSGRGQDGPGEAEGVP